MKKLTWDKTKWYYEFDGGDIYSFDSYEEFEQFLKDHGHRFEGYALLREPEGFDWSKAA